MSTLHVSSLVRSAAFVLAALASGATMAQDARLDGSCAPQMTHLQQRLYQHANAGPTDLRNFLFIRRSVLEIDISETAAWAGSVNAARAACMRRLAEVEPGPRATQVAGTSTP